MGKYVITNNDELRHYGVLGMKWGVRRAAKKSMKQTYRKRTDKAFAQYEKAINAIEKPYKRGQNLSDKDVKREAAAEKRYMDAVAKAKADYKSKDNYNRAKSVAANKLYSKQSSKTNAAINKMSTGKAIGQSLLLGSYGALKYNEARAAGASRGAAVCEAILHNWGNNSTNGLLSASEYIRNRRARKKKG